MKRIYTWILMIVAITAVGQNGTRSDTSRVIVGSKVIRFINVLSNDNAVSGKTYTLDTFYYSATSSYPSIEVIKLGNQLTYQENQGHPTSDSFFYVAKDQFGNKDTNFVLIYKSDLSLDQYPGDANKDNICNHLDVLNLGIAYGQNYIAREGIYKTDDWTPIRAYDWLANSAKSNNRYADLDGNGTIDSAGDINVILKNYNQTVNIPNSTYSPTGGQTIQIAALDTFKVSGSSTTFQIDLRLGNGPTTAVRSYGIAMTFKYDTNYFKANQIHFNPSKWFIDQHNTLNFARVNHPKGEFDLAIVRRDGSNKEGSGSMGVVEVIVVDILGGLTGGLNTSFELTKVALIDSFYNLLPVTLPVAKAVHMKKIGSSVKDMTKKDLMVSQDHSSIYLENSDSKKTDVSVYNMIGSPIYQSKNWENSTMVIDTRNWNPGVYIIQYKNEYYKIKIH